MYYTQQSISAVYFLSEKFKTSPVIPPLEKPRLVIVFKQGVGSTGGDDSNFEPKQGGDSEKTLSKLPNKKSKQTLAGPKGSKF